MHYFAAGVNPEARITTTGRSPRRDLSTRCCRCRCRCRCRCSGRYIGSRRNHNRWRGGYFWRNGDRLDRRRRLDLNRNCCWLWLRNWRRHNNWRSALCNRRHGGRLRGRSRSRSRRIYSRLGLSAHPTEQVFFLARRSRSRGCRLFRRINLGLWRGDWGRFIVFGTKHGQRLSHAGATIVACAVNWLTELTKQASTVATRKTDAYPSTSSPAGGMTARALH